MCFSVHSSAVNLQNANAKFHNIGRVETLFMSGGNVYISVRKIYSGQCVPNFVTVRFCKTVYQKNISVCFSVHSVEVIGRNSPVPTDVHVYR